MVNYVKFLYESTTYETDVILTKEIEDRISFYDKSLIDPISESIIFAKYRKK